MTLDLEKKTAREALEATTDLAQCTGFTAWYVKELKRLADEQAQMILHHEMSAEARENLRQRRLQLLEIIDLPSQARHSAVAVLGADSHDME